MNTQPLAVVFGGSRGIGAATVDALVRDGHAVVFTHTTANSASQALVDRHGAAVQAVAADIRDPAAVAATFDEAARHFGRPVQVVVANAGINVPPGPLAQFSTESFRDLVEVNIVGAFNVLREAARQVADQGAIVALTTSLVRHAVPGVGPYSATKAAVESLVKSMARELAPRGVRVNGVAPGPVDTELFRAGKTDEARAKSAALSPFNRIGTPAEVAEVVAFLVSPKASWVHGQVVQPNGGLV